MKVSASHDECLTRFEQLNVCWSQIVHSQRLHDVCAESDSLPMEWSATASSALRILADESVLTYRSARP